MKKNFKIMVACCIFSLSTQAANDQQKDVTISVSQESMKDIIFLLETRLELEKEFHPLFRNLIESNSEFYLGSDEKKQKFTTEENARAADLAIKLNQTPESIVIVQTATSQTQGRTENKYQAIVTYRREDGTPLTERVDIRAYLIETTPERPYSPLKF